MNRPGFTTFEHEADIGIKGWGTSLEEAFAQAAHAMFSLIRSNVQQLPARYKIQVHAGGYDLESLFVDWLNSLLAQADLNNLVLCKFDLEIQDLQLAGAAWGAEQKQDPEQQGVEVKGATFTELQVVRVQELWIAQCVVDV